MENECNKIYQDLLNRIIESGRNLYGELAIRTASKVEGLEMSQSGKVVKISGPPENVIRDLLLEYEALGGRLSRSLHGAILAAYRNQFPNIKLPEG